MTTAQLGEERILGALKNPVAHTMSPLAPISGCTLSNNTDTLTLRSHSAFPAWGATPQVVVD